MLLLCGTAQMADLIDILVVGAGPAGGNAALAAARHGKHVVLLDEQVKPGGQIWRAKDSSILSAPQTPESSAGDALRAQITKAQTCTMKTAVTVICGNAFLLATA